MKAGKFIGVFYALLASMFNGTVGVMSVKLFENGLTSNEVAFYKCIVGLSILLVIIIFSKKIKSVFVFIRSKWLTGIICSFFGFFILYHFETKAYTTTNVPTVVFLLFGSATVFSFVISAISEKRTLSIKEIITIAVSLFGLYVIFSNDGGFSIKLNEGMVSSVIAGIGYGGFLLLSKRLKFGAGIAQIFTLLLFGSIYLSLPVNASIKVDSLNYLSITLLLLLAILPTIGGFWCTTKALTLTSSQSVQLVELSEPVFSILFSLIILGQQPTLMQVIGGGLIFLSIYLHEFNIIERLFNGLKHSEG